MKAILKYPGSKWSLADWIISYFPKHHSYLEPFFGSGAVLFCKPRSNIETVNDLDSNIVNLFECIRENPQKLASMIYMTPYARDVYEQVYKEIPEDKFEAALNFYIKLNMGHGFRTTGEKVGWKNDIQGRERSYPPYMLKTRHGKQYRCEMNDKDHEELLRLLLQHKGPVFISGYDTDLYGDMLSKWSRCEKVSYSQVCSQKQEILWMNFEPSERQLTFQDVLNTGGHKWQTNMSYGN